MSSRTVAAALLVLLVVLAGCGDLAGGPTSESVPTTTPPSTATSTVTTTDETIDTTVTAATPTVTATTPTTTATGQDQSADRYPPGVTDDGVADAMALAEAHADLLRDHSYTTNETVVSRFENGTLALRIDHVTHRNESAHRRTYRVSGPLRDVEFRRLDVWYDGTERRSRWTLANGSIEYQRFPGSSGTVRDASDWKETIYGRLGAGPAVVTETDESDPFLYRLVSEDLATISVENVSIALRVDERGFVHEYRYEYDQTVEGSTVRTVQTVRFKGLGGTVVERPPWYDAAVNATGG